MAKQKTKSENDKIVIDFCRAILDDKIMKLKFKIFENRLNIRVLSEDQRKLKASIGKLYEMRNKIK